MIPALRWLAIAALALVGLAGLAIAYLFFGLPKDRLVEDLRLGLSDALGQEVTIEGTPRAVLTPWPGIEFGALRVGGETGLLSAETGLLTLSADDLKAGALQAGTVHLRRASLLIERGRDGAGGWPWTSRETGQPLSALHLEDAEITLRGATPGGEIRVEQANAAVSFDGPAQPARITGTWFMGPHEATGTVSIGNLGDLLGGRWSRLTAELARDDSAVTWRGRMGLDQIAEGPAFEGTVTGRLTARLVSGFFAVPEPIALRLAEDQMIGIEATLTRVPDRLRMSLDLASEVDGRDVTLDLRLTGDREWMTSGVTVLNSVTRVAGLASVYLDGSFGPEGQFDGTLAGSLLDLPEFLRWSDAPHVPGLPLPRTLSLKGPVILTDDRARLDGARVTLDGKEHGVDLDIDTSGATPLVRLSTATGHLDLSDVVALDETGPTADLTWLAGLPHPGVDLDLTIEATSARLGTLHAGRGTFGLLLREKLRTARIDELQAFGGDISADLLLGGRGPGTLALEVKAGGIDIGAALAPFGSEALSGAGEGLLRVVVPDALAPSPWLDASGDLSLTLFGGDAALPDLFSAARGQTDRADTTRFSVLSAEIGISAGTLSTQALRVTNATTELSGGMSLDLASLKLDGRLDPRGSETTARLPLEIRGTLFAPEVETLAAPPVLEPAAATEAPTEATETPDEDPSEPQLAATGPDETSPAATSVAPAQETTPDSGTLLDTIVPLPVAAPR